MTPSHVVASLGDLAKTVEARLERLTADRVVDRIWQRDHAVWKPDPTEISNRLGWLTIAADMRARVEELEGFAARAAEDGFTTALLLGMGGSSLAPEVLRRTFGVADGALDLRVLDSTHPTTIARVEESLDPDRTLFVIASKSGTTVETLSHLAYFWDKAGRGEQFVAITDPGTPLETLAAERAFRATFLNPEDIGGRYSALSLFGLVPAALIGMDLRTLLGEAEQMAADCRTLGDNPGAWLGAVLGEAALDGRDKLTLALSEEIISIGPWIEQLIAESTGKDAKGILPIDGEDLGPPEAYGDDRLFVGLDFAAYPSLDSAIDALEDVGQAVVWLSGGRGTGALGAEFFRWEFATAVAGYVLGINPFDQPNVQEAKDATARILEEEPGQQPEMGDLEALLQETRPGDYVAIQAFVDATDEVMKALQTARLSIRDRYRVATTVGIGPRFLHSTGQLHKGGPDAGVFIQVVDPDRETDRAIPGKPFSFRALLDAQALGDYRALVSRRRRVARTTMESLARIA
ncbi:MAG: glucose-6-phosphate isomerase [Actinomycetota bacterium]